MIKFLRRIFGGKRKGIFDDENEDNQFDAETQEMILSSFDLLERMVARGEDMSSERAISHFFVGNDSDVERASRLFEGQGFLIGLKEGSRLHVVERSVVDISWVEHTIPLMLQTGGEFELDYDGWDCGPALGPRDQMFIK